MKGKEIANMKKAGVSVTCERKVRSFAFICDTAISVLEKYPCILQYPIIFIECTFLYHEELSQCEATKHIHWDHLCPYVQAHPDQLFVLIHFSLRYEENEIIDFFENEKKDKRIGNVKVWAGQTDC
jgi:ribonuclease Z